MVYLLRYQNTIAIHKRFSMFITPIQLRLRCESQPEIHRVIEIFSGSKQLIYISMGSVHSLHSIHTVRR